MDITTVMLIEYWLDSACVWHAKITVDNEKVGDLRSSELLDVLLHESHDEAMACSSLQNVIAIKKINY